MPNEEICEVCGRRPSTSLLLGQLVCSRCRADILGWPPVEREEERGG